MATLGCSGPKLFSSMASARRINGSASTSRLVALSSPANQLIAVAYATCSLP